MTGPSPPTDTATATAGGGIFGLIGRVVVRWPWLVLVAWIGLAAGLTTSFPTLAVLAQRAPSMVLPDDAPSIIAAKQMMEDYHEGGAENILIIVLVDDKGLSQADEDTYRNLVAKMKADTDGVSAVQEFISVPPLKEVLASKDGKAWLLPVSLREVLGTPKATATTKQLMETARKTVAGTTLTAYMTGPAATLNDIQDIGEHDRVWIEAATIIGLFAILLMVYRNPLTMLMPLITIAVSLVAAQGVIAGLGVAGLEISNQTIVLLTAIMAGAGTDYAVFLISRYHDFIRQGATADVAVQNALTSVGKVISASAATVAVTFLGMIFTKLAVFSTVGVALAVAICVGCLGALTFLPALLVLTGRRGWAKPRRDLTSRFWKRSGIRVVRRPVGHLVASLILLTILGGSASLAKYNYDDRKALPPQTESIRGYDAISQHFPLNASLPQYILIKSPHDLRTAKSLADMEQMAFRVSQVPDIDIVRGITRPTGEQLEQTKVSFQAGEVGSKLNDASTMIGSHYPEIDQFVTGSGQVADWLTVARGQLSEAIGSIGTAVSQMSGPQNQHAGTSNGLQESTALNKLLDSVQSLANKLGVKIAEPSRQPNQPSGYAAEVPTTSSTPPTNGQAPSTVAQAGPSIGPSATPSPTPTNGQAPTNVPQAGPSIGPSATPSPTACPTPTNGQAPTNVPQAGPSIGPSATPSPTTSPTTSPSEPTPSPTGPEADQLNRDAAACEADPVCREARNNSQTTALLQQISDLTHQLQTVLFAQPLGTPPAGANPALGPLAQALQTTPDGIQSQLAVLDQGAAALATAGKQLADGIELLVGQTKQLNSGLEMAAQFLMDMKREATTPAMAGFYIPSQILTGDDFRKAASIFISPDGHTARYLVQTKLDPFSPAAMDQIDAITAAARSAQPNTTLSDAKISMTGFSVTLHDTRDYYNHDLRLIVTATILVVLTILIVLLRALVAPLYLILSVIVSYLSALGLGVLTFQYALHQQLHWSVPGLTFIILVAVGADYNLLLISRIRDESPHGIKSGVIRTVTQTGGVITAAGLIFAASMLGLQFSSITTLVQVGFIIGVGILLDTFIVRTITVPAIAVLVGKANWWPSKWTPPPPPRRRPRPEPESESASESEPSTAVTPE